MKTQYHTASTQARAELRCLHVTCTICTIQRHVVVESTRHTACIVAILRGGIHAFCSRSRHTHSRFKPYLAARPNRDFTVSDQDQLGNCSAHFLTSTISPFQLQQWPCPPDANRSTFQSQTQARALSLKQSQHTTVLAKCHHQTAGRVLHTRSNVPHQLQPHHPRREKIHTHMLTFM